MKTILKYAGMDSLRESFPRPSHTVSILSTNDVPENMLVVEMSFRLTAPSQPCSVTPLLQAAM